jgi:malonate transporter MadL subunit
MMIYGVAILAGCFLVGQIIGETLGRWLHIDANVGGVGFAMLLLIIVNQWMHKRKWFTPEMDSGVIFWSNLYIPVIVAMSSIQNVKGALSGGMVALLAGIIPTSLCLLLVPLLSRMQTRSQQSDIEKNLH